MAHGLAPSEVGEEQELPDWLLSLPVEPDVVGKAVREMLRARNAHPDWTESRQVQFVVAYLATEEQRYQRKVDELRNAWHTIGAAFKKKQKEDVPAGRPSLRSVP